MELLELIRSRRSISKVRPEPVPRAAIQQLLDAAVSAPNHKLTRPWRFWVLAGGSRNRLGDVMAEALRSRLGEQDGPVAEAMLAKQRAKPLRAPVIIVVGVKQETEDPVVRIENIESAAAAIENMLLAARALGLGAMWRTGQPAYWPEVKEYFGLDPEDHIAGFVYVGTPEAEPPPVGRSTEGVVTWEGWE